MIHKIVKLFHDLSEKHRLIKSFKYDRLSKGMGIGDELMPHVFLEDPIYIGEANTTTGVVPVTVNFDIVITPQMLNNYSVYPSTEAGQNLCENIALNFIARLKEMTGEGNDLVKGIVGWSFVTLKHWSDNDADGVRCTLIINVKNEINFCDVSEHFDPDKEFNIGQYLTDIKTDDANGCAVFDHKLPKFNWKQ